MRRQLFVFAIAFMLMCAMAQSAMAVTLAKEIELGEKLDAQLLKDYALYADENAQKQIEEYGQNLAKFVNRPEITYHFKILEDNQFNAFSIPGGYVYFTSRLWNILREEERIGVIGHEIVHIDNRHALDAISKQQKRRTILAVLLIATRASSLAGDVASMAEQLYSLKFSRRDEEEADFGAVEFCEKAGYNPAGILLSMYKIRRFEDEAGGAPPKIFSDHPPTKERLDYLKSLLTERGIPIPEEIIETVDMPDKIGEVVSTASKTMTFTSSKPLNVGDIVWVTRDGWDSRYEKRTPVPAARCTVTSVGSDNVADVSLIATTKTWPVTKGMEVYAPPAPEIAKGIGTLKEQSAKSTVGVLQLDPKTGLYDRLMAVQPVWNSTTAEFAAENVGYLVVLDPTNPSGYVGMQNQKYAYAPMQSGSTLVKLEDPDQNRWVAPVISVGVKKEHIEVPSDIKLDASKTYDVAYPALDAKDSYKKRVVGTARADSSGGPKVVLKFTSFSPGWKMSNVKNGFDVYERPPAE